MTPMTNHKRLDAEGQAGIEEVLQGFPGQKSAEEM